MSAEQIVVIGIGNALRGDDGVGPAILDALRDQVPRGVTLVETDGEPTRLLEAWEGADLAVVLDAVPGTAPGRVRRIEPKTLSPGTSGSHGLGAGDAVELGELLDRLPERLVIFGIEGANFAFGPGLSPAVRAAIPEVLEAVLLEITGIPADQTFDERDQSKERRS
jgi:hydrogenase maturation protease